MTKREEVVQSIAKKVSDQMGGNRLELTPNQIYKCQTSLGDNPEEANQYGVKTEQILHVISDEPFSSAQFAYYSHDSKNYRIARQVKKGRLFYITLVEVAL